MNETLVGLGVVSGLVWPATQIIGEALRKTKQEWMHDRNALAAILGIASGVIAHGSGQVHMGDGFWGWAQAPLFGLFATAGAVGMHKTRRVAADKLRGNTNGG